MVRRMVEAINAGEEGAAVQELFAEFRSAFPD